MTTETAVVDLPEGTRRRLSLAGLFGAFVFLQFTVLGLANRAGEGYLTTEQRDLVYYALQAFVILGYLLHGALVRGRLGGRVRDGVTYGALGVLLACVGLMLVGGRDSLADVVASMAAALCVGAIGGAVHLRMSLGTVTGEGVAWCMGLGSASAVVMQYLLQIQWGVTPLLPVFVLAATAFLLQKLRGAPATGGEGVGGIAPAPTPTTPRRIAGSILVAAAFILFACFYNEHIHHLMIQSDYASYSVYSWPRLMLVPGYLLFAAIGDRRGGRYVPLASLCVMLITLLNVVLVGSQGTYWLNMCLFYLVIAAFTSYYLLTFWRLAPGTDRPALWAPFGRMLDSGMVLLTGAIHLSELPAPVVLGMDIAGVALVIVVMALNGDFNLAEETASVPVTPEEPVEHAPVSSAPTPAPVPTPVPTLEERVSLVASECGLSEREAEVLAQLVLTEDKNQQIADRLGISRRQLQTHISHIYAKTEATTRAGLIRLMSDGTRAG